MLGVEGCEKEKDVSVPNTKIIFILKYIFIIKVDK